MTNYKEEDFENLRIPVHLVPSGKNVYSHKDCSEFSRFKEFKEKLPFNKSLVLKYIVYCYDMGSPLASEKDLGRRKDQAFELAGYETNKKGDWVLDEVHDIRKNKNEIVNRMILRYCRMQKEFKWPLLSTLLEQYHKVLEDVLLGEKPSKDPLKAVKDIEDLSDEIFMKDKNLVVSAEEVIEEEKGDIVVSYPEYMARKIKSGKTKVVKIKGETLSFKSEEEIEEKEKEQKEEDMTDVQKNEQAMRDLYKNNPDMGFQDVAMEFEVPAIKVYQVCKDIIREGEE